MRPSSRWSAEESDEETYRCRYDSELRLARLDEQGIAAELISPDTQPPFYPSNAVFASQPRTREDYERRHAGLQAHNRWMVDFCSFAAGRRRAPVQVFLYDIDDAFADIRWGAANGLSAVLVPAIAPNHVLDGLWSERYDPVWAVHWFARRSLSHMIFGGVFDRFPDLKLVMTEEGLGWAVPELRRLDHYVSNVVTRPDLDQSRFGGPALAKLSLRPRPGDLAAFSGAVSAL